MTNFTRDDWALELSRRSALSVDRAKGVVAEALDILAKAVVEGHKIEFRGFGVIDVVTRKPKIGRNPKNPSAGQYQIPARRVVRFRAGTRLFDALNPQ
jgi:integration host factor subunit beta